MKQISIPILLWFIGAVTVSISFGVQNGPSDGFALLGIIFMITAIALAVKKGFDNIDV